MRTGNKIADDVARAFGPREPGGRFEAGLAREMCRRRTPGPCAETVRDERPRRASADDHRDRQRGCGLKGNGKGARQAASARPRASGGASAPTETVTTAAAVAAPEAPPEVLKADLRNLASPKLAQKASRFRCDARPADPSAATKFALRSVARRYLGLVEEAAELRVQIERLVKESSPQLVALDRVGPDTAATLSIVAGDNPERLKSEAAFANLCGAAPIPASSGKVVRHRLNPHDNRDANRALHVVALNRLRRDPRTQAYVARRTAQGKSKREIVRCLKRFIAREVYRALLVGPEVVPKRRSLNRPA